MYFRAIRGVLITTLLVAQFACAQSEQEENGPGGERPGPPPEAFEACADKSEGDSCSVEGPGGRSMEGQCKTSPRGDEGMMCMPAGGPPDRM